jgi:hypothetical protein
MCQSFFLPSLRHESQGGAGQPSALVSGELLGLQGPPCVCPVDLISVCALYVVFPKETIIGHEDPVFCAVVVVCFIDHPELDNISKAFICTHREKKNKDRGNGGSRYPMCMFSEGKMETGAN